QIPGALEAGGRGGEGGLGVVPATTRPLEGSARLQSGPHLAEPAVEAVDDQCSPYEALALGPAGLVLGIEGAEIAKRSAERRAPSRIVEAVFHALEGGGGFPVQTGGEAAIRGLVGDPGQLDLGSGALDGVGGFGDRPFELH